MHFHFCQKYECLGAKNVVLWTQFHFGLGTVSKVPWLAWGLSVVRYCPRARVIIIMYHQQTLVKPPQYATRQPEEHPGLLVLMAICWFRRGPFLPNSPNALYSPPPPRLVNSPLGGHVAPGWESLIYTLSPDLRGVATHGSRWCRRYAGCTRRGRRRSAVGIRSSSRGRWRWRRSQSSPPGPRLRWRTGGWTHVGRYLPPPTSGPRRC